MCLQQDFLFSIHFLKVAAIFGAQPMSQFQVEWYGVVNQFDKKLSKQPVNSLKKPLTCFAYPLGK